MGDLIGQMPHDLVENQKSRGSTKNAILRYQHFSVSENGCKVTMKTNMDDEKAKNKKQKISKLLRIINGFIMASLSLRRMSIDIQRVQFYLITHILYDSCFFQFHFLRSLRKASLDSFLTKLFLALFFVKMIKSQYSEISISVSRVGSYSFTFDTNRIEIMILSPIISAV